MKALTASELRIGNWIEWEDDSHEQFQVQSIIKEDSNCFVNGGLLIDMLPIRLTEEWLIKLGFNRRDSSTCTQWFIGMNDVTHDWLFDLTWLENPVLINAPDAPFYRNGRHTIFYVHQLQNLYFALIGEELTIKETVPA